MKNKRTNGQGFFGLAVIISMVLTGLLIFDAYNIRNQNVKLYCERTQDRANEYIMAAKLCADSKNQLVSCVKENFDTSASIYCIVSVDDEIIFVKDRQTTLNLKNSSYSDYINSKKAVKLSNSLESTVRTKLKDGKEYLVSTASFEFNGAELKLSILSRTDYVIKQGKFDLLLQHIYLYSVLFALGCIAIAYFQMQKRKQLHKTIDNLKDEMAENRKQIETLIDEKNSVGHIDMNNKSSGFISKSTMDSIIGLLSPERKKLCYKIYLKVDSEDSLLKVALLFDRIKENGCVSCLESEERFMILLLNANEADAKTFMKNIRAYYEQYYQEEMPGFDIKMTTFA